MNIRKILIGYCYLHQISSVNHNDLINQSNFNQASQQLNVSVSFSNEIRKDAFICFANKFKSNHKESEKLKGLFSKEVVDILDKNNNKTFEWAVLEAYKKLSNNKQDIFSVAANINEEKKYEAALVQSFKKIPKYPLLFDMAKQEKAINSEKDFLDRLNRSGWSAEHTNYFCSLKSHRFLEVDTKTGLIMKKSNKKLVLSLSHIGYTKNDKVIDAYLLYVVNYLAKIRSGNNSEIKLNTLKSRCQNHFEFNDIMLELDRVESYFYELNSGIKHWVATVYEDLVGDKIE